MPRNPDNNPTERIERLLLDFEETRHWADLVLAALPGELLSQLPPFPNNLAFFEESIRHRLNRSHILASRKTMARSRFRRQKGEFIRGTQRPNEGSFPLTSDLLAEATPEELAAYNGGAFEEDAAFAAEVEAARAAAPIESAVELQVSADSVVDPFAGVKK